MQHIKKAELRRYFRQARQSIDKNKRKKASQKINRQLYRYIKRGARMAVYWPIGSELSLEKLIQTAKKRKAQIYLPYIENHSLRLWFTPYQKDLTKAKRQLKNNAYRYPNLKEKNRAHHLNVLFLPLLAIDCEGYRLGQGGGYYDVTLKGLLHRLSPKIIGVGFSCQRYKGQLPRERHDIKLQRYIDEQGNYRF